MDAAVRTLGERAESHSGLHRGQSSLEELVGETGAATHQQRQARLFRAIYILAGGRETLFIRNEFLGFAPPHGEGVGHPPPDGGDVQVDVLARLEGPGPGHLDRNSHGIAWQGLHQGSGRVATTVAVHKDDNTSSTLGKS